MHPFDAARAERTALELITETAGCADLDAFRETLWAHLHALVESPLLVLAVRCDEAVRVMPSRGSEAEWRARDPEGYAEQGLIIAQPPVAPVGVVTRDFPGWEDMAMTQNTWRHHGAREAVGALLSNANGFYGFLAVSLADRRLTPDVERLLRTIRPWLSRRVDALCRLEPAARGRSLAEAVADRALPGVLLDAQGRAVWVSPAARPLLGEGRDPLPRTARQQAMTLLRAWQGRRTGALGAGETSHLVVRGRRLVFRYRVLALPEGEHLLVTVDAPEEDRRRVFAARARALGLTGREAEVAWWAARGLLNKQIAERLEIREQTVKNHLKSAFRRVGARSRTDLARMLWG